MMLRLGSAALAACLAATIAGASAAPATPTPAAASAAGAAAQTDSPAVITVLMARGDELLKTGDLAAARLCYQRAADDGYAKAATALGTTYDPLAFAQWDIRGIEPDPATAADWYRKAVALGDADAKAKLSALVASGNLPETQPTPSAPAPPLVALPAPGKATQPRLTQQSVEAILSAAGASYRMIPPAELKVDYPGINYAWVTSDEVFGAVIQVDTGKMSPADAALAFVSRVNSGCAGSTSLTIGSVDALKGEAKARRASSACTTASGTTSVEYVFIHNPSEMTVFMALSPSKEAADRHSTAILSTVRKMILAAK